MQISVLYPRVKKITYLTNFVFLISIFSINTLYSAANTDSRYIAQISKVKVYREGAEISYVNQINLKKGYNQIILDSLPANVDESTIRVLVKNKSTLMAVNYSSFTEPQAVQPKIIKLYQDTIKNYNTEIAELRTRIAALEDEERYVLSIKPELFKDKISTWNDIANAATFVAKKTNDIKKEKNQLNQKISDINTKINELTVRVQNYYKENPSEQAKTNYFLTMEINSENAEKTEIVSSFYTGSAGWTPKYDIEINDIASDPLLISKADVWQNTGFNWNDVKLTLNGELPVLSPWNLGMPNPNVVIQGNNGYNNLNVSNSNTWKNVQVENNVADSQLIDNINKEARKTLQDDDLIDIDESFMSYEFTPKMNYTILTDGEVHTINLESTKLKAKFEYLAIPKIDASAYLTAKIANPEDLRLLSAEANIYFNNTFIGSTNINANQTSDTFQISLGKDEDVAIKRTVIQNFNETKFLSSNVERTFGYKIKVKNNKKSKISIVIKDQIPISTHEKIEIEKLDISGASLNPDNGILHWTFDLESGKSVDKIIKFKVTSPKEVVIGR
jgi:uncharacterized protein (TIGR02231 family)